MTEALVDRREYPSFPDRVYLNQASIGMLSSSTVSAMTEFILSVGRFGNIQMSDQDEVLYLERLRIQAGFLFGCPPRNIAILGGASELLGQLPPIMIRPENGEIVLVSTDFPALTRPWIQNAAQSGKTIKFVRDEPGRDLTDALIKALVSATDVVAVSHIQYSTGTAIDVERLAMHTSAIGARLVIDATQSAGAMDIREHSTHADVVISSGYKWLGGHGGVAVAYISDEMLLETPVLTGWMSTEHPFDFDATSVSYAPDARRFSLSTMSYASIAALSCSLEQILRMPSSRYEAHSASLSRELIDEIAPYGWSGHQKINSAQAAPHILAISHPTHSVVDVHAALLKRGVICGVRNNRLRISIAAYNNSSDIQKLVGSIIDYGK